MESIHASPHPPLQRRKTRPIRIGSLQIGGNASISIQSMTNTKTHDVPATVKQINGLVQAGCEIVRIAVPDMEAAQAIPAIKAQSQVPIIADIHYDYRLALESLQNGIDGLRLNPGNIRQPDKVKLIVEEAGKRSIPIRIGVNGGSLNQNRYPVVNAENMVQQALEHIVILEDLGFKDIKVSLKATDVMTTIQANQLMAQTRDYPLHIGVTEAGTLESGIIKNSIGIGTLLSQGIGDTIRVSISVDPIEEIRIAKKILKSLGIRKEGVEVIACPTCGRTTGDVMKWADILEQEFATQLKSLSIAVMGCQVNGVGESRHADIGLILDHDTFHLYQKGKWIQQIEENKVIPILKEWVNASVESYDTTNR